jgi:F420H(2)-dependent quinone reductase
MATQPAPRINQFLIWLLHSPFSGLASTNILLLTITGRKSGRFYEFPVRYVLEGNTIIIAARKEARWWKNLVGGAKVTMQLRGKKVSGIANAFTDEDSVASTMRALHPNSKPERIQAKIPYRIAIRIALEN